MDAGYILSLYNVTNPAATPSYYNSTSSYLRLDAFFDFDYILVRLGAVKSVGHSLTTPPSSSDPDGVLLTADVMGKLPVVIQSLRLWTGLGLRYVYMLYMDYDGDGLDDRASTGNFNDLAAIAEIGASVTFGETFVLGLAFLVSYDVTPDLPNDAPSSASSTSITFEFTLHVGFSL